jgi:hypothetical protein
VLHGHSWLGAQPRAGKSKRRKRGMTRPTAKDVKVIAHVADVPADDDVATRIANSIGPAFDGFAPISGTLPFDLEPASFLLAQIAQKIEKVSK